MSASAQAPGMKVTVIICTWNRAQYLDAALTEMRKLKIPAGLEWELLIVNNNSTDNTDEVLARHSSALPLRRLFEKRAGKSFAANYAISQAAGDLLLFTDDDVLVSSEWIKEYAAAAGQWPEAAFFGGTIDPYFEAEPPQWIKQHLVRNGPYSVLQHGETIRPMAPGELGPIGANMAIRMSVFRTFSFDTQLGPIKEEILPGEDGELFLRLRKAGHYGVWVGTAKVRHRIAGDILTGEYIWNWYREHGRTQVRRGETEGCKTMFGLPRWALRKYLSAQLTSLLLFPVKGEKWVNAYTDAARALGIMQEFRSRAQSEIKAQQAQSPRA